MTAAMEAPILLPNGNTLQKFVSTKGNAHMTKAEYLTQVRTLSRRIDYHNERLRRLRDQADAVTSRWGEHTASSGKDAPYVHILESIEAAREELEAEERLLVSLRRQVEDTVNTLPEDKLRFVLLYRYIEERKIEDIAELMYTSLSSVKRWIACALELLVLPEDPISIFAKS